MNPLERQAAHAAKEHVARIAVLAAEAVDPLSFPREQRAAIVAAAIPIVDREFRRNLAELEEHAYTPKQALSLRAALARPSVVANR